MLHKYYWCCDIYSAYRQIAIIKKIFKFLFLAWRMRPALPTGAVSAPHFASSEGSTADYILCQHYWCYPLIPLGPNFSELTYQLDNIDRKWKYGKYKMAAN
jgi:hypothetical protein